MVSRIDQFKICYIFVLESKSQ